MIRDHRELILADSSELHRLDKFIEEICDFYNISNEYFGTIQLATNEAVQILWSLNENKADGGIIVDFGKKPEGLNFKIKSDNSHDSGELEGDILEHEIKKHKLARDIYIVKALADEVQISARGNSISLIFFISGLNYEKSLKRINELIGYWSKQGLLIKK